MFDQLNEITGLVDEKRAVGVIFSKAYGTVSCSILTDKLVEPAVADPALGSVWTE